jgi:hypothetical protein
MVRASYL